MYDISYTAKQRILEIEEELKNENLTLDQKSKLNSEIMALEHQIKSYNSQINQGIKF